MNTPRCPQHASHPDHVAVDIEEYIEKHDHAWRDVTIDHGVAGSA
jgi:hypothetical protein